MDVYRGPSRLEPHPEQFVTMRCLDELPVKPGQLTKQQLQQYYEQGFLVIRDFFTSSELEPCIETFAEIVSELAEKLYKAGKIDKLYEEFGVYQRLNELEKAYPGSTILLFKHGNKLSQGIKDLWSNEKLLNMMEQILGPDIACHPVWNIRYKASHNEITVVPWHQDCGYFSEDSYDHIIPTAWIPFLDATVQNGTMEMVRGSQRSGKVATHTCCVGDTWLISLDEETIQRDLGVTLPDDIVTCEVPFGGFILFNNLTVHRSLPNVSNDVRWAIDLRWQSPNEKWGFFNIVEGLVLRSACQSNIQPDWGKFQSVDRKAAWQKRHYTKEVAVEDEFDTIVTGPWLARWPVVNRSRHIDAFQHYSGEI